MVNKPIVPLTSKILFFFFKKKIFRKNIRKQLIKKIIEENKREKCINMDLLKLPLILEKAYIRTRLIQ